MQTSVVGIELESIPFIDLYFYSNILVNHYLYCDSHFYLFYIYFYRFSLTYNIDIPS